MNTVPRLLEHPSWQTITSFSTNELIEFIMLGFLAVGVIGVAIYWIYRAAAALIKR